MSNPVSSATGGPYFSSPATRSPGKRKVRGELESPPSKKTCVEQPTIAVMLPQMRAFRVQTHPELREARARAQDPNYRPLRICPAKPKPSLHPTLKAAYEALPFIQSAHTTASLIGQGVVPFELEVAPGVKEQIDKVDLLSKEGQHSVVYLCEVRGKGKWVLKLYKPEILDKYPNEAVLYAANQLRCYSQNCQDLFLRLHVAQHLNFDPHLEAVREYTTLKQFKAYVQESLSQGFLFAEYVPEEFPLDPIDRSDKRWIQLQELLNSSVPNDTRRSNVRVDAAGIVKIVDLLEEDRFSVDRRELRRTFTDRPEDQEWLWTGSVADSDDDL